jgi:hypothetical protein
MVTFLSYKNVKPQAILAALYEYYGVSFIGIVFRLLYILYCRRLPPAAIQLFDIHLIHSFSNHLLFQESTHPTILNGKGKHFDGCLFIPECELNGFLIPGESGQERYKFE